MTAERWSQIEAVFEEADTAAPRERGQIFDHLCGSDANLCHEVESLLAAEILQLSSKEP